MLGLRPLLRVALAARQLMGSRVRVLPPAVDALLRLETEERRLAERMQRDMVRRTHLRVRITHARCSLTAEEAREYESWARLRDEDRRMAQEVRV